MIAFTEQTGGATTLAQIETLTRKFSEHHAMLAGSVADLEDSLAMVRKRYLPTIRAHVARTAKSKSELHAAVAASPGLFEKPRTLIMHGVKVGFTKGKGGIEFEDGDKVVALIRKVFGADAPAYIRTKEEPDKKMLQDMPVSELKRIGCTVADTGDVVVIKPVDGEVEKIVAALLKDAVEAEVL